MVMQMGKSCGYIKVKIWLGIFSVKFDKIGGESGGESDRRFFPQIWGKSGGKSGEKVW